jgi:hypothetical protein
LSQAWAERRFSVWALKNFIFIKGGNKMNIINVTTKEQLDALYNQSALTWEGLIADEENLNAIKEWLNAHGAILEDAEPTFHITSGELMNDTYGLTGDNAYVHDLTILSVTNIDQMKIIIPRLSVGGRWFDDIVDNNARREVE